MVDVGVSVHESVLVPDVAARRALLDRVAGAGLDHVTVGDHVSFHGGAGFDGLVAATAALCAHDRLGVLVGVYQLALRHPMVVARQLASVAQLAPGRLVLGVGAGGEDRAEVANCGVDPATRGRRLDESLGLLRQLATGAPVDHKGEFFTLEDAAVVPAPDPAVPLVVGGGSDAALRRAAERGDGWLGMFCSARRFARSRADVIERRAAAGRDGPGWFGLSVWCGLDENGATARTVLGERMQALYRLPPEKFANVTAAGTPEQVADWLAPYVEAGAGSISIVPAARSVEAGVELAGEVRRHLEEKAGIA
jgi:alkanesulfonate monooxygenase SsuD/methylene tetrahydromethanopterin reductase-like flavin-dependent oxidoreductase (luciferase family)